MFELTAVISTAVVCLNMKVPLVNLPLHTADSADLDSGPWCMCSNNHFTVFALHFIFQRALNSRCFIHRSFDYTATGLVLSFLQHCLC